MAQILETERLVLRDWRNEDLDRVYDIYRRWEVVRGLGKDPKVMDDISQAQQFIDIWNTRNAAEADYGLWAIEIKETGALAGAGLLVRLPDEDHTSNGEIEMGWHLHPDCWGFGYATESGRALIQRGFDLGLEEVYAVVYPDNERSLAACRRLGMQELGRSSRWYDSELEVFVAKRPRHYPRRDRSPRDA
jgi:RimJ/RimL family protein N-acetyltransferase